MEETQTRETRHKSQTEPHKRPQTHDAMLEPESSFRRRTRRKTENFTETQESNNDEEVEKKIGELQRIVPGGELLGADELFEETAAYILSLRCQIKATKALTGFLQGFDDKEKMKSGG